MSTARFGLVSKVPGVFGVLGMLFTLTACGEKPQTSARKADVPAYQGTAQGTNPAYMAAGWKAGDAVAWEQQLRARSLGQNEYSRASTP